MDVAGTQHLFGKKDVPFSELDKFFKKVGSEVKDGYAVVNYKDSLRYLFIIEGKPYAGAVIAAGKKKSTAIKDFFTVYKEKNIGELHLFKADKKILLCMLVRLNHNPSQVFSTDTVNIEDVVKKIEENKKDVVMSLMSDKDWGFAIFIKGNAIFAALPFEEAKEEPPLDRLLLYSHTLPQDKHLSIELYMDTKVVPSEDSVEFPHEGIAAHFTKLPYEHYVELIEEGAVKGTYPIKEELSIGRDVTNDIHLTEAGASREHAVIKVKDGKYMLEDLKSANGTFFKGVRITTKELHDGDEINIRKYVLRFHGPKKEEKKKPEAPDLASQTIYAEEVKEEIKKEEPKSAEGKAPRGASLIFADGSVHSLKNITTIGKDEEADIKVEGMFVAKRHATIIKGKDVYKIIKKGGLSALKINGEKIDEHILKDGDLIEVGGVTMTFNS